MFFPINKVRLVAINDNFDTINDIYETDEYGNLKKDFRIKNMFDEAVVHDISAKVSINLNERAKEGLFIAPRAPFGYKKTSKHKLGIDPIAAQIVKRIFNFVIDGTGITEIARTLSEEGIPYTNTNGICCFKWRKRKL